MKLNNIKFLLILLVLTSTGKVFSQSSNLLYYMENVPQINYLNPAMMPRANSFLGFPGLSAIGFDFKSDIAPKDIFQKAGSLWVHPLDAAFDYDKLYKSIGKSAVMNASVGYTPIYFGFRTHNGYFTFSIQQKVNARFGLPQDMFRIAEKGFDAGTTLNMESLETKLTSYHEISIGYAHKIDNHLTVGAHIKPLSGLAAAHMKFNKFYIENNRTDYQMQVDGEFLSSIPFIEFVPNEDGVPEDINTPEKIKSSEYSKQAKPNFSNFGLAVDLGAVYDLNSKFTFSASLNNLGYIKWKKNLNSTKVKGSYEFTGPDLSITEDIDSAYAEIGDNIVDALEGQTGKETFSTTLAPELYLGSAYHVNHVFDMGFLSKSTFAKYNFRQEFILSANLNLYKTLTTTVAYNHEIGGSKDLGLGLALRAGPAQLYILANHIPFYYDKIVDGDSKFPFPTKMETFSLMAGVNFVFGKHGYQNRAMIGNR